MLAVVDGCVATMSAQLSRSLQEHGFMRIFGGFGVELIFKQPAMKKSREFEKIFP